MIFALLKKFWKPLAFVGTISLILFWVYFLGYRAAEKHYQQQAIRELTKRYSDWEKIKVVNDLKEVQLQEHRESLTDKDSYDSCVLSGNPFSTKC